MGQGLLGESEAWELRTLGGTVKGGAGSWLLAWLYHVKPACEMRGPREQTGILNPDPFRLPKKSPGILFKARF